MNKLLPEKKDLVPITNPATTFYDCGFNVEFDKLDFKKKLEVVNDLVRQTILTSTTPNPNNDVNELVGNCHTAALVSIEYLKYLNVGKNHRYVFGKKRKYDPEDMTTKHALVLVDDEYGNTYQFDPAPFVGYKYGYVEKITNEKFYDHYEEIKGEKLDLLKELRTIIYNHSINNIENIDSLLYILNDAEKHDILNGYTSNCYNILSNYCDTKFDSDKLILKSFDLNPYDKRIKENNIYKNELKMKQIKIWQEELYELEKNNTNLKRQLELGQNIIQELKLIDNNWEKWLNIGGNKIRFSHLTPRFFYENGYNIIMIKASAYHLGVRATIRESFLKRGNGVINEYFVNLAQLTDYTNLKPMLFSHPMGDDYERSMNGTADVIMLKRPADELYVIKKRLRNELGQNILNKMVTWTDGEKILWHPFVTNLIHSTDNPSESCLHFLIAYPEHQLMTRFMFPNINLEKVKVK